MATEATFTVSADQFPLGTIFQQLPEVTIELERIIPAERVVIPYFWVRGTDAPDIETSFQGHPGVEAIQLVDSVADHYLLRVEWNLAYDSILTTVRETDLTLIDATGTVEQWTFNVRGDDQQAISTFQQRCQTLEIPVTLRSLHALTPLHSETETALTDSQREALALAQERGYFETPRNVTMADLGGELGITPQAVASRLRRGIQTVVETTLPDSHPPE